MRGEHVGDARARLPQADGRIGVDPFRAQPLHLGAAFVDLDDAVLRRLLLLLLLVLYGHIDDPLKWVALVKRSSRMSLKEPRPTPASAS